MVELCFTALPEIDNIQLFKSRSQTQGIPKHFHARFCKKSLHIEVIDFFFWLVQLWSEVDEWRSKKVELPRAQQPLRAELDASMVSTRASSPDMTQ